MRCLPLLVLVALCTGALAADNFQKRVFNAARDGKMSDYQRAMKEWDSWVQKELKALRNKPAKKAEELPRIDVNFWDDEVCEACLVIVMGE
jgi:hypothetical protein